MTSTSEKTINVLNKNGNFVSKISLEVAEFSVKRNKSIWVDSNTIQLLYHKKDLQKLSEEVYVRDNYTCQYCGEIMEPNHPEITVDHVLPERLGGSVTVDNMVCSCKTCNQQKGYRTFKQYFWNLYAGITFMLLLWSRKRS